MAREIETEESEFLSGTELNIEMDESLYADGNKDYADQAAPLFDLTIYYKNVRETMVRFIKENTSIEIELNPFGLCLYGDECKKLSDLITATMEETKFVETLVRYSNMVDSTNKLIEIEEYQFVNNNIVDIRGEDEDDRYKMFQAMFGQDKNDITTAAFYETIVQVRWVKCTNLLFAYNEFIEQTKKLHSCFGTFDMVGHKDRNLATIIFTKYEAEADLLIKAKEKLQECVNGVTNISQKKFLRILAIKFQYFQVLPVIIDMKIDESESLLPSYFCDQILKEIERYLDHKNTLYELNRDVKTAILNSTKLSSENTADAELNSNRKKSLNELYDCLIKAQRVIPKAKWFKDTRINARMIIRKCFELFKNEADLLTEDNLKKLLVIWQDTQNLLKEASEEVVQEKVAAFAKEYEFMMKVEDALLQLKEME